MKLSVIIPCYNEENTLKSILDKVSNQNFIEKEIIVIDDFSTDNSRKILANYQQDQENVKIIYNLQNKGKGYSIRQGLKLATGDIILIQDADLEYSPDDYKNLIKPILDGNADVVFGSRFIGSQETRVLYFWHTLGNRFLTLLSNMLTNLNLTDMECCYKVFKKNVIKNINLSEDRFGFEPEITAKISKKNLRIYEIGVKYFGRKYEDGKKITWKDGFAAIFCIVYYNLF
jgi:glycosyltransferase involved in cell wall biosynthesis